MEKNGSMEEVADWPTADCRLKTADCRLKTHVQVCPHAVQRQDLNQWGLLTEDC